MATDADNPPLHEEVCAEGSPLPMVCRCGLPMTRNPHPQAGTVSYQNDYGYAYECIPCLVQTRNRVGRSWRAAEAELAAYHEFHEAINGKVGLLRTGYGDPKEHADAISKAFGVLGSKRIELARSGK